VDAAMAILGGDREPAAAKGSRAIELA